MVHILTASAQPRHKTGHGHVRHGTGVRQFSRHGTGTPEQGRRNDFVLVHFFRPIFGGFLGTAGRVHSQFGCEKKIGHYSLQC